MTEPSTRAPIVCFGDLLIDFVPTVSGTGLADAPAFQKAAGGAAANVAVGLARLGAASSFMGKVGDDAFGRFLAATLEAEGVGTTGLRFAQDARTPIAFVSLQADGEREFLFYRDGTADRLFTPDEVDPDVIAGSAGFHFDGLSLTDERVRATVLHAAGIAAAAGRPISFDVNFRRDLWRDLDAARAVTRRAIATAGIVKLSDDELELLTGERDPAAIRRHLWHDGLRLVALTMGGRGSICITAQGTRQVPTIAVAAVDTTGAGDGFMAGLLQGLMGLSGAGPGLDEAAELCRFANIVGALTATARGAIPALPRREQVAAALAAAALVTR